MLPHADWSRTASLYEVNVRQFTAAGTLKAFEAELPRLAALGVGILWFMPIQPIGVRERKGTLGSYYAVADYTAVNPEFGTLADFKAVVQRAQALGMKVLLDWVANHTAWDHPWVAQHPDWYRKDERGEIHAVTFQHSPDAAPEYWTDVVALDYRQPALWPAMTEAMCWWLRESGIDGFRCDVAALVPLAFWQRARRALEAIKPVFMLAEAHEPELHDQAFDMTYDWDLYEQLKAIAQGRAGVQALRGWWLRRGEQYPADAYRLIYTANHDTNSWHGHCAELYGGLAPFKAMAVLVALLPGMPLLYGGQESFFERRLAFFERDPIDWKGHPLQAFYAELLKLKRTHPALANGTPGNALRIEETGDERLLAFTRGAGPKALRVCMNLSSEATVWHPAPSSAWRDEQVLPPWGWLIT